MEAEVENDQKWRDYTLWSNPSRSRYYIVPDQVTLTAGNFEVRSVSGGKRMVDEAGVARYEVTKEEAKEWAKEQFGLMLDATRSKIESWIERLRNYSPPPTKP